jgi:hypothetical protein
LHMQICNNRNRTCLGARLPARPPARPSLTHTHTHTLTTPSLFCFDA